MAVVGHLSFAVRKGVNGRQRGRDFCHTLFLYDFDSYYFDKKTRSRLCVFVRGLVPTAAAAVGVIIPCFRPNSVVILSYNGSKTRSVVTK